MAYYELLADTSYEYFDDEGNDIYKELYLKATAECFSEHVVDHLDAGLPVTELLNEPLIVPTTNTADLPPRHFYEDFMLILSKQLYDLLINIGAEFVQVWRVTLRNSESGAEWPDYFGVNLPVLSAMNLSKSNANVIAQGAEPGEPGPASHYWVHDLVIDPEKTMGHCIFGLANICPKVIIDQVAYDALIDNRPEDGWYIRPYDVGSSP